MKAISGAAAALFLTFPTSVMAQGLPACTAPIGQKPMVAGTSVRDDPGGADGYRRLRVEARRGAHLYIYFDAASEAAARSRAECLGAQLNLLQDALADNRQGAEWASVTFTSDQGYVPPRDEVAKVQWVIHTQADGLLSATAQKMVVNVVPHEQVHDFQYRAKASSPRWFAEGHATWVGGIVTAQIDPAAALADRSKAAADLAASHVGLDLANWGSVRPRREAIMRQVSAEDRAKMEADPDYMPSGAFRFIKGDLIGDETNMNARYAGAWNVFLALEKRHGAAAVRDWVAEVTSKEGPVTEAILSASVERKFGESLDALLLKDSGQSAD